MKIRDNETGEVFEYGTNMHHALRISENGGCLIFENLQNGDGSLKNGAGGYSFVLDDGKTPEESLSPDAVYGATYANIGGFHGSDMKNEGDILKFYYCESEDDYYLGQRVQNMYYAKYEHGGFTWFMSRYLPWGEDRYPSEPKEIPFMEWIEGFIRKHMNDGQCGDCSRRKWYQKGYEDGSRYNDGWIPVEERLPEETRTYIVAALSGMKNAITLAIWKNESKRFYITGERENYKVVAWRHLPEPYWPGGRAANKQESIESKRMREREEFFRDI